MMKMRVETGNWKLALLAAAWIVGCLVFVAIGFVGCSTVGPVIDNLPALTNAIPEPGAGEPAAAADALNVSEIVSYEDAKEDWRKWPITQSLSVKLSGNKAMLTTEAVKIWKDGGGDVCASLHFVVKRGGKWRAFCFDYVRPGQTTKDKAPPRPPCKEGEDYETVSKDEECYIVLTGLVRDHRRNVRERTNIVRVQ